MLETGSLAPDMVLEDTTGKRVRLADFRGAHPVLVYFTRSITCAVCNRHIRDLVARADEFAAADVRVLIAVPEDRAAATPWKAKHRIPFPVLTARDDTPHEMVGLTRKLFGAMQQSGSILVDAQGRIRHGHAATMPTGAYDRKGITAAIASLPS
ncbi:peroxiredoxin family protein [Nocardia crassostreae]|uniref:peroxiredoxin family protein n=1 Tax=Nocardia crassostreae TaxID=53428 RepID=UPI0008335F9D|nr:peroxiredoxin family protein [Nocardia crassostreae]